jgi:phosphoenolpyruvate-protein phosphotransferase (PTS system enzyme I)
MKKGIAASKGYAIGHVVVKDHIETLIVERLIEDTQAEKERFYKAVEESKIQIRAIKVKTAKELGEDKAEVFASHIMILEDPELISAVENSIQSNKINCEKALDDVIQSYIAIFESMDNEYMRERAADIKDV